MHAHIENIARHVLTLLAEKRYGDLEQLTRGIRLGASDISNAVTGYGKTITSPPNDLFQFMDIIEVKSSLSRRWSVSIPVWTLEEGRSDLSAELTLIEDNGSLRVEFDDLHVL